MMDENGARALTSTDSERGSRPRVVRNDWSSVTPPDLEGWRPTLSVSVVIPAFQCQPTLDLTLASLSRQTYPADLLEVVVVDDRSDPPLTLPAIAPARTRLLRVDGSGWGRANALHWGARHSTGEILHWLDADMVAYPEHVAAQARWQHVLPYAVTLGYKRFVDGPPWPTPEAIVAGPASDLFGGIAGDPHTYVERYITQTDQLRSADHLAFRIHVGATAALRRELYDAAGGVDPRLRLGEDTEFGYRLAQAGAVFVPEPQARSWHLGRTHVMRAQDQVTRYNRPFLADLVPYPRHWRRAGGPSRTVPLAEVVVPVDGVSLENARSTVDAVLRGTEPDVRVSLVGPFDALDDARVPVLSDPRLDLRLIAATYRAEPRVRLVTEPPQSAFPAPYRLDLPAGYGLAPDSLRRLVDAADRHQVGLITVRARSEPASPAVANTGDSVGGQVQLWRTAALGRARWTRLDGELPVDTVTSVYGSRSADPAEFGIIEPGQASAGGKRRGGWTPTTVEVEGVRSLARATVVVAWLGGRRVRSWLRGRTRRGGG
jgi:glycosyltransferase involved in cell wall biosynthesis